MDIKLTFIRGFTILGELLVTLFYSVFIVCFATSILCAVFLQFAFAFVFLIFAPFFALIAALPGLIAFGLPAALAADMFGFKKRMHWIALGIAVSIPSYYLVTHFLDDHNILFFITALAIGAVTGSKLHYRLYINKEG